MQTTFDVIVVGGGIAGTLAAISASRMGSNVLLIEETGCLGGSLTTCGTGPMMTFHAGTTQVIKGITDELIQRLVKKKLSPGHIPDSTGYTYTVTPFDAEGMKHELELMAQEASVTILFHTMLDQVEKENGKVNGIGLISCGKHIAVSSRIYIDASGDGDFLVQADVPCNIGREKDGANQPMTMNFRLSNVDIPQIRELMDQDISLFPFLTAHPGLQRQASRLSCSGFQEIMKQGIKEGKITFDRDIVLFFETNTKGEVIVNMTRINGLSPVDPLQLSNAEIEGRRQVWELYAFMKEHVPGFHNAQLISSGPSVGIRTSRRMVGCYTLTERDILSERHFDDAIAAFGYPIDIHSPDGAATRSEFLRNGAWYTVPYRVLTNQTVPNIIATGRLVSCTFEAMASVRLSPLCGAMGQAAGVAASLCTKLKCYPSQLDVNALQRELLSQGAFLG